MSHLEQGCQILDYLIGPKIGRGAFGEIYSAIDTRTGIIWALKTESNDAHRKTLNFEFKILAQVQSSASFPRLGVYGRSESFSFISEELLGPSLSHILKKIPGQRFSLSTAIRASYHILKCIESFHVFGFVHRDIKPGNILTREGTENPLCLIDFGLARVYVNPQTGQHLPARHRVGFRGTRAYASRNAHMSLDLSRRDDLISWFYLTYEFAVEQLPWRGEQDKRLILEMKENFNIGTKVSPVAPELFEVWRHINSLSFTDTPNYQHIYQCLMRICRNNGFKLDDPFDWSDFLHEHRNIIARAIEHLQPSKTPPIRIRDDNIEQRLLGPNLQLKSPFSHISETETCGCC
ncbi:CK1 family protein kinase [Tritrichomonas foetus]|uniref:non-specific serine/threonine protein kinase n=1 Tax=Tritrichomonas foetus TaxID=1144522 RepID=A0A1J4KMX5_9EUKA|nr:CK1 family protein kinase [Tritrichomonas foetus]|eukprot:OHT12466.1 CK1 family protein kinase [Tritrichomonas foetus]